MPATREISSSVLRPYLSPTPVSEGTTARTLALSDAGATINCSSGSATTVTIPPNASVAFDIGTRIRLLRTGGLVTISPDSGVTLLKPSAIKPPCTMAALVKFSGNQTGQNYSAGVALGWDAEVYKTVHVEHSNSVNPSRLTPASGYGISKVRLQATVRWGSTTAGSDISLNFLKSGGAMEGGARQAVDAAGSFGASLESALAEHADGAYYEVEYLNADTSTDITASASSFNLVVEEINPVGNIAYQYGFVTLEKKAADEWVIYGPALG